MPSITGRDRHVYYFQPRKSFDNFPDGHLDICRGLRQVSRHSQRQVATQPQPTWRNFNRAPGVHYASHPVGGTLRQLSYALHRYSNVTSLIVTEQDCPAPATASTRCQLEEQDGGTGRHKSDRYTNVGPQIGA